MVEVIVPSTLSYKDRLTLKSKSLFEYNTLYASDASRVVWDRLVSDASVRQDKARKSPPYKEGCNALYSTGTLSGFETNTHPAVYTHTSFKPGHNQVADTVPVETLHPIVARKFKKKYPMDFLCNIRPDTETTNQTLRMLGTYETDYAHAERMGVCVPAGCPAPGPSWFHPDVQLDLARKTVVNKAYGLPPWNTDRIKSPKPQPLACKVTFQTLQKTKHNKVASK